MFFKLIISVSICKLEKKLWFYKIWSVHSKSFRPSISWRNAHFYRLWVTKHVQLGRLGSVYLLSSRTVVSAATVSPPRSWRQQQTVEPLLRFPFANFLANPCGVMASTSTMNPTQSSWPGIVTERSATSYDSTVEEQSTPAPLRAVPTDGSTLAQQTLGFLGPLRDRYTNRNYTREERSALAQEFHLVVLEAIHLARHIYPPSVRRYLIPFVMFRELCSILTYSMIWGFSLYITATAFSCNHCRTKVYSSRLRYKQSFI